MPFSPLPPSLVLGDVEIASLSVPCRGETVSGDGLFVETGRADGGLMLLMVDVAGHGPAAARIARDIETLHLTAARCRDRTPGDLLTVLNGSLQRVFAITGKFVAGLAVLVGRSGGAIRASTAGQPAPVLTTGAGWVEWSVPGETVLGVADPASQYADGAVTLAQGDRLLLFSDGITEAGAYLNDQFQQSALGLFLSTPTSGISASEHASRLLDAARSHAGQFWPEDDATTICLFRR